MGRRISDTHTMRWKVYYIHPQSGYTLFVDSIYQAAAGCLAAGTAKICGQRDSETDRQRDRDRIAENNGSLGAPANNVIHKHGKCRVIF